MDPPLGASKYSCRIGGVERRPFAPSSEAGSPQFLDEFVHAPFFSPPPIMINCSNRPQRPEEKKKITKAKTYRRIVLGAVRTTSLAALTE